jgi:hypothetical protein
MATRLESAIARVIAEGKVRTYDMSGRRGEGGKRFHTRRRQSHRRLRQFLNRGCLICFFEQEKIECSRKSEIHRLTPFSVFAAKLGVRCSNRRDGSFPFRLGIDNWLVAANRLTITVSFYGSR